MYQDLKSKTEDLLAKSNHCSLHVQRIRKLLCEVYKIVSNISPDIVSDIFQIKKTRYTSRKVKPLEIPRVKTVRYGINSLRYQGSKIWNELPNDIKKCHRSKPFQKYDI